jgi:hypothetical protein
MSAPVPIATEVPRGSEMTQRANRRHFARQKHLGLFAVSNEPPYGASMPEAGFVHYIKSYR